jgi:hypothetical protein
MVQIAVAGGALELAEIAAGAAVERRAEINPDVRSITATAAHAQGLLTRSLAELARAVELFAASPRPLALAPGRRRAYGNADTADRCIDALDRGLALFAQAGATRDAGTRADGSRKKPRAWGCLSE